MLRLAGESRGDHQLLDELLAIFCDAVGASGVAIYSRHDEDLRQEQALGEDGFPARLNEELEEGLSMLSLPGGRFRAKNIEVRALVPLQCDLTNFDPVKSAHSFSNLGNSP